MKPDREIQLLSVLAPIFLQSWRESQASRSSHFTFIPACSHFLVFQCLQSLEERSYTMMDGFSRLSD